MIVKFPHNHICIKRAKTGDDDDDDDNHGSGGGGGGNDSCLTNSLEKNS